MKNYSTQFAFSEPHTGFTYSASSYGDPQFLLLWGRYKFLELIKILSPPVFMKQLCFRNAYINKNTQSLSMTPRHGFIVLQTVCLVPASTGQPLLPLGPRAASSQAPACAACSQGPEPFPCLVGPGLCTHKAGPQLLPGRRPALSWAPESFQGSSAGGNK